MIATMGYDVDRKPATWVMGQSARRERLFFVGAAAVLSLSGALVVALAAGYRMGSSAAVVILAACVVFRPHANNFTDRHFRMLEGAIAESTVGETLNELRREPGWFVMHDFEQAYEGNVDHLVSGPNGAYMIDTKLHRYEDSHLTKAKRQAAKLHDELGGWVTPVICTHSPRKRAFRHQGVWIVPHRDLLRWLRAQRNQPIPFERLARFADHV